MKKFFSKFDNRAIVYGMVAGWLAPSAGVNTAIASSSITLGLIVSIITIVGTFLFLIILDYLLFEKKRQKEGE